MKNLLSQAVKTEEFNSNNAWGFGGAAGTRYYFNNDVVITIAKATYRHTPSNWFITVRYKDRNILDKSGKKLTDKELLHVQTLIKF